MWHVICKTIPYLLFLLMLLESRRQKANTISDPFLFVDDITAQAVLVTSLLQITSMHVRGTVGTPWWWDGVVYCFVFILWSSHHHHIMVYVCFYRLWVFTLFVLWLKLYGLCLYLLSKSLWYFVPHVVIHSNKLLV